MIDLNNVSRETTDRLELLSSMVQKWNSAINLIAASSIAQLRDRHLLDSAQLIDFLPEGATKWVDLGSGGGFPGLVVATLLAERAPACHMTMIESDQRKTVFLREAARAMGLMATVITARIEDVPASMADVVSARALAPLPLLFQLSVRHLRPNGVGIFMKGQALDVELADADRAGWCFDAEHHKSVTDASGTILIVRNLTREPRA